MKTELSTIPEYLLWERGKKVMNALLFPAYVIGAHWYDALCGVVSNAFTWLAAMAIMFAFLFMLSVIFVGGHTWVERKLGWDLMGLEEFKGKQGQGLIPWWRIFKRFKRWMTKTRKTTFWIHCKRQADSRLHETRLYLTRVQPESKRDYD